MPRSLVTGGAGFLGSHLVDSLLELGHDVAIIDDMSGGSPENLNPRAQLYTMSVTAAEPVEMVFEAWKPDYVYHLAAYAAEGLSPFIRRFNYQNNLIGSVNLINASIRHKVKCFVFTSSVAVYGIGTPPFTEDQTPAPIDPYGIAKYAVELDLAAAHATHGLPYIIFRPYNVYGERQNLADPYRNVVGIFMRKALAGEPLPIFGDGTQIRAFTHVSDVAPVIANSVNILAAYQQIFNVGSGVPNSINFLATAVQQAMEADCDLVYMPGRHEVQVALSDHKKAKTILNAQQRVALEDGLRLMARWAIGCALMAPLCGKVWPQTPTPFAALELTEGLPKSWRPL